MTYQLFPSVPMPDFSRAACRGLSEWFDAAADSKGARETRECQAVCRVCPVAAECLTWARDSGMRGVFGGQWLQGARVQAARSTADIPTQEQTKTCIGCGETKSVDDYYTFSRDGERVHIGRCKPCIAIQRGRGSTPDKRRGRLAEARDAALARGEYVCGKCEQTKPLSEFVKGAQGKPRDCRECNRAYQRERDRQRKMNHEPAQT